MEKRKDKKNIPANGLENSAFGTAMLGNFKPADANRSSRDISLGNFEPTNKKQDNGEEN